MAEVQHTSQCPPPSVPHPALHCVLGLRNTLSAALHCVLVLRNTSAHVDAGSSVRTWEGCWWKAEYRQTEGRACACVLL